MRGLAEGVPPHRHALRETGRSFSWDVSACNDPAISQTTVFRQSLILVADTTADGVEDYAIRPYPRNLFGGGPSQAAGDIHRGGANILFCDGHAEWRIQ